MEACLKDRKCSGRALKQVIKVLIADDNPHLISGVEKDLESDKRIKIVGVVNSYYGLLDKVLELKPDVVLLDLKMPGLDKYGLSYYITKIKEQANTKIIIFTNDTGWARIYKCLELGASGYIEKAISLGKLSDFIRRVYEYEEEVIHTQDELPQIHFSKRQKEVLHLVADGKENEEIAMLLKIQVPTVKSCLNDIKLKIQEALYIHPVRARTLTLLAVKLGFGSRIASY